MKKYICDLTVADAIRLHQRCILLKLTRDEILPPMKCGQFTEVRIDATPSVLLRRPISIHRIDKEKNELWLLVQTVGGGTQHLAQLRKGDLLNVMLPLGNGFTLPDTPCQTLLVGGGVGVAPLLQLGVDLKGLGCHSTFLLGARTANDVLQVKEFEQVGDVYVTTEDGSMGEQGFVTQHSLLKRKEVFDKIYCCGPKPMMMAVTRYAHEHGVWCEVSLENRMACGVGACLCCVEKTKEGHRCVCTDGPVFNINDLTWLI
ncbi:MAG: dihydroorotate dehydrogenase electron transfer subunit [Bacteroidales bacterium]|nr:dihydroorotate dehydrogenase electron transfer subunit [Bacteroidales bacterium]